MFWTDAWKLSSSLWADGLALHETALAASGVIKRRSATTDRAIRHPLRIDVAEPGRTVPEKMATTSNAGNAIAKDWLDIHTDLLAQGRDIMTLYAGWPPSLATLARIGRRGSELAIKLSTVGGRALEPVRSTTTGNNRRLNSASRTAQRS